MTSMIRRHFFYISQNFFDHVRIDVLYDLKLSFSVEVSLLIINSLPVKFYYWLELPPSPSCYSNKNLPPVALSGLCLQLSSSYRKLINKAPALRPAQTTLMWRSQGQS